MTLATLLAAAALTVHAQQPPRPAGAEGFPSKPIRMILPLSPGSSSETGSRFVAEKLAVLLGGSVVPENRPGGETKIAVQALLAAPADGHALLMVSPTIMVVNPLTIDGWDIDVRKRIRPLVQATRSTATMVVSATSQWRTLDQFLAAAKASPGRLSVANYSGTYLLGLSRLARGAGTQFNPVSYKGAGPALTDVIGGSVDAAFVDLAAVTQLVEAGKLRALAVTSASRSAVLPQVPTVRESLPALRDFEFGVWIGYAVRAETPEPIVKVLESALISVLRSPEYLAFNKTNGNPELIAADGASLARHIDAETEQLKSALPTR